MSGPIIAFYHLTEDDWTRSRAIYSEHAHGPGPRRRRTVALALSLGAMLLFLIGSSARRMAGGLSPHPAALVAIPLLVAALLYFVAFRRAGERRRWRREFARLPSSGQGLALRYAIDEAGIVYSSPSTPREYPWDRVTKLLDSPQGFLAIIEDFEYLWFPRSSFRSPDDLARFAELARDRVDPYQILAAT